MVELFVAAAPTLLILSLAGYGAAVADAGGGARGRFRAVPAAARRTPAPDVAGFDAYTAALITWWEFSAELLPSEPFALRPGESVSDPDRFYAALRADISAGPGGSRAFLGLLRADLARLKLVYGRPLNRRQLAGRKRV